VVELFVVVMCITSLALEFVEGIENDWKMKA
jgi:hypothetical protein